MLSIVVTTRNDNHGGKMLHRLGCMLESLDVYRRRYQWDMELVLVDWNPPEHLPMREALPRPPWLKIIEVPAEVHRQFPNSDIMRIFYCIGQNVGARHASGEWVLVTGQDMIFSPELAAWLGSAQFNPGCVYRAVRADLRSFEIPGDSLEEWLAFCRQDVYIRHDSSNEPVLTNAAGDFQLMHRDAWYKLRGYPEWPLQCVHLDGLFINMAVASGLQQVVAPGEMYHINHYGCLNSDPGYIAHMPKMCYFGHYAPMVQRMRNRGGVIPANDEHWGLAQSDLVEVAPNVWRLENVTVPCVNLDEYYARVQREL